MDSNMQTSPPNSSEAKAEFRKPSNDAANRHYRRRSPVSKSSSSEGSSPQHGRCVSPIRSRDDLVKKGADTRTGRDGRELDRDSNRNQNSRHDDSYIYSGLHSSKSSHGYSRHDRHAAEDRQYDRLSSRSGQESRFSIQSDHPRQESEVSRSKDYSRNADKYSHDRYDGSGHRSRDKEKELPSLERQKYKDKDSSFDRAGSGRRQGNSFAEDMDRDQRRWDRDGRGEKGDYHRSSGDRKGDYAAYYEESRSHWNNSSVREKDNDKYHLKEGYKSGLKEMDGQKPTKKERIKPDEWENNMGKDRYGRVLKEQFDEKSESPAKKPKLFSTGKGLDHDQGADEQRTGLEQTEANDARSSLGQMTQGNDVDITNDVNAARVAAMKAAELVNRKLIGAGHSTMTTEQKKKLLWGSKKSTATEESGHHWDTAQFVDRERQEKFNKLMGVRGDANVENKPNNQEGSGLVQAEKEKQRELQLQLDLEKQYTAGLRRRDGRTVGLGL